MNKILLPLLVFPLAVFGQAQPPAGRLAAAGAPPKQPLQKPSIATDTQILEYGSFELPRVKARTPRRSGGDFLKFTEGEWMRFNDKPDDDGGKLVAGVTNEVARTGRQSLYIEFTNLTKPLASAEISSQLIAVKPESPYRVSIWGRMDKKQPLTIEQRIPNLFLQVDFFQADRQTQTGDQVFRIQPMPGSRRVKPFFNTERWAEYYADVTTPEDAGFVKITWKWSVPPDKGETNGVMYFDDATLIGPRVEDEPDSEDAPDGTPAAEMEDKPEKEVPESTEPDLDLPPEIGNRPAIPQAPGAMKPAEAPAPGEPAPAPAAAPTATPPPAPPKPTPQVRPVATPKKTGKK